MNKRGSVSTLLAFGLPTILVGGIFAIDAGRIWLAQSRLQAALDAASLSAARDNTSSKAVRDANAKAVFASNINGGAPPVSGQGTPNWTPPNITDPTNSQVQVQATIDVKPLLGQISGLGYVLPSFATATQQITRTSVADRTTTGLELALVIDVTLSMVQSAGSKTRIAAAHEAAHTLLATLYGDDPTKPVASKKKWLENLYISVVPFNVTANYGSTNTHFLSSSSAPKYDQSWSGPTSWGGCVEMRSPTLLDANPTASGAGLRHYFWPSTYKPAEKYVQNPTNNNKSFCRSEAAYKDTTSNNASGANNVCMGHNDWTGPAYVLTDRNKGKQNTLIAAFQSNDLVQDANLDAWTTAHGPNMMCPPDSQRVLPLTRDRTVIETRIDALRNLPFSYGTNIAAGLQAGWFTLSPNWRNANGFKGWPSAEPPATASDPRPELPNLPLDYYADRMDKVMVLLTDGDNLWLSARDVQSGNTLVRPESVQAQGFYGSYGYLAREFDGDIAATSTSDGSSKIDDEAEDWCAKIKSRVGSNTNEKVTIYTIGFGSSIGSRATATLTNCASLKDGKRLYYPAPTAETLKEAFKSIGNELARLRLSQ